MKEIVLDGIVTAATDWVEARKELEGKWTVSVKFGAQASSLVFHVDTETVRQISVGSEVEVVIRPKAKP